MRVFYYLSILSLTLIVAAGPNIVEAAPKSPFLKLSGSWRGKGSVKPPGSKKAERVSCRVRYKVRKRGVLITQNIKCVGHGYWIRATSKFRYTPGSKKIEGTWTANYGDKSKSREGAQGRITGDYIGDVISISLDSESFSTGMTIKLKGRKQVVDISSLGKLTLRR